jgi:hypothetical protein
VTPDPFGVLGLAPGASADDIRAARRRLALEHHPDRGGDPAVMRALNAAFVAAMAAVTADRAPAASAPRVAPDEPRGAHPSRPHRVERDEPSFVIELLPVEAFEALLVVASWIGEVLVDEPPYLLEVHLHEPTPCWCRLELVPDAGASTVSLVVDGPLPAEVVRDLWIEQLNRLGRWEPS